MDGSWDGPFTVGKRLSDTNYSVIAPGRKRPRVLHVNMLKPYLTAHASVYKCKAFVVVYIDDIGVHSHSWKDHCHHIDLVLTALRDAGLTANISKCEWGKCYCEFLGHVVGQGRSWNLDSSAYYHCFRTIRNCHN